MKNLKQLFRSREKLKAALFLIALLFLLGLFFSWRYSQTGLNQSGYEGKIIDISADFRESQFGSILQRRLLIEDKNGARFEITVNSEIYDHAQIGMMIKNGKLETSLGKSE